MKIHHRSVVAAFGLAVFVVWAASGAAQTTGNKDWKLLPPPDAGPVTSIHIHPVDPDVVYVLAETEALWKTTTGPAGPLSWIYFERIDSGPQHGCGFAFDETTAVPDDSTIKFYLTKHGGVEKYNGNQGRWYYRAPANELWTGTGSPEKPFDTLELSPDDPDLILLGCDGWIVRNTNGARPNPYDWQIVLDLADPPFDEPFGAVFTDIDFSREPSGPSEVVWASTADMPTWAIEDEFYTDAGQGFTPKGVFFSSDSGLTWQATAAMPGSGVVYNLATVPGVPSAVFAATTTGLFLTVDFGSSWASVGPPLASDPAVTDVAYVTEQGKLASVYIGTRGDGVYRALPHRSVLGPRWVQIDTFPTNHVSCLGVHQGDADLLYAGYLDGKVFASEQATQGSSPAVVQVHGIHGALGLGTLAFEPGDAENVLYTGTACMGGLFQGDVTDEDTVQWTRMGIFPGHNTPADDYFHYTMRIMHPVESVGGIQTIINTDSITLYRTPDEGVTWEDLTPPPGPEERRVHLHGLARAPSQPGIWYTGTGHGKWVVDAECPRIWRRAASGVWTEATGDLQLSWPCSEDHHIHSSLFDIAVHPDQPDHVYIASYGNENEPGHLGKGRGRGVFRTFDASAASPIWEHLAEGLPDSDGDGTTGPLDYSWWIGKVALENYAGETWVYIATLDGAYRRRASDPQSVAWEVITPTQELPLTRFEALAVDPYQPGHLFLGSAAGDEVSPVRIYDSEDGGLTWALHNIPMAPKTFEKKYRVRDIQVGRDRAYAVVGGSGAYLLELDRSGR